MSTAFNRDLAELAVWIGDKNPDAAERFIDAVEKALGLLEANPEIGTSREMQDERLRGLRIWPISEFPDYLILYLPSDDGGVLPLRVIHGHMDYPRRLADDLFTDREEE